MNIRIALAGNPNSGKTTLFNALTGSNQFVGNWPGVTVEKKEGKLKKHDDVVIMDLPGIYSLSPYTLEEVVSRNYLITERPDAILNIVDGTNLERNLYLTTQLTELGIPVVVAINMMDVVKKNGDQINIKPLRLPFPPLPARTPSRSTPSPARSSTPSRTSKRLFCMTSPLRSSAGMPSRSSSVTIRYSNS